MKELFLDKFKSFLKFIVPCVGFILPWELKDGHINGGEFGNESADVL